MKKILLALILSSILGCTTDNMKTGAGLAALFIIESYDVDAQKDKKDDKKDEKKNKPRAAADRHYSRP